MGDGLFRFRRRSVFLDVLLSCCALFLCTHCSPRFATDSGFPGVQPPFLAAVRLALPPVGSTDDGQSDLPRLIVLPTRQSSDFQKVSVLQRSIWQTQGKPKSEEPTRRHGRRGKKAA